MRIRFKVHTDLTVRNTEFWDIFTIPSEDHIAFISRVETYKYFKIP